MANNGQTPVESQEKLFLRRLRKQEVKSMRVVGRGLVSMSVEEARQSQKYQAMLEHAKRLQQKQAAERKDADDQTATTQAASR